MTGQAAASLAAKVPLPEAQPSVPNAELARRKAAEVEATDLEKQGGSALASTAPTPAGLTAVASTLEGRANNLARVSGELAQRVRCAAEKLRGAASALTLLEEGKREERVTRSNMSDLIDACVTAGLVEVWASMQRSKLEHRLCFQQLADEARAAGAKLGSDHAEVVAGWVPAAVQLESALLAYEQLSPPLEGSGSDNADVSSACAALAAAAEVRSNALAERVAVADSDEPWDPESYESIDVGLEERALVKKLGELLPRLRSVVQLVE